MNNILQQIIYYAGLGEKISGWVAASANSLVSILKLDNTAKRNGGGDGNNKI